MAHCVKGNVASGYKRGRLAPTAPVSEVDPFGQRQGVVEINAEVAGRRMTHGNDECFLT